MKKRVARVGEVALTSRRRFCCGATIQRCRRSGSDRCTCRRRLAFCLINLNRSTWNPAHFFLPRLCWERLKGAERDPRSVSSKSNDDNPSFFWPQVPCPPIWTRFNRLDLFHSKELAEPWFSRENRRENIDGPSCDAKKVAGLGSARLSRKKKKVRSDQVNRKLNSLILHSIWETRFV